MRGRTSRRRFIALATGALSSVAAALGRAVSHGATARPDAQLDAATRRALPGTTSVTSYTYDAQSRLLSISECL